MKVRIGTRGSDLALWQARHVASLLARVGVETELEIITTRGDRIDDVPLSKVEGKAFFTAELERALLDRQVDLAVHSHKDLPTEMVPELVIAAVPPRGPIQERLLVAPGAHAPDGLFLPLAQGARVGTSSPRRAEQLRTLRPDLTVLDLRGNVPTRVRKLREGQYHAILLAAAGLERLGLDTQGLVVHDLALATLVPAPAQGALGIQVRADDRALLALCREHLHDEETARTIAAERSLLVAAGGGCSLPLGASIRREQDGQGYVAEAFLGAGHPEPGRPARWVRSRGASPAEAAERARAELEASRPTGVGPLAGMRIALTGAQHDGSLLGERLASLGADVRLEGVIALEPIAGVDLAGFLRQARAGDVVAVTSRQAARMLRGLALAPGIAFAAVGRASARALKEGGHEARWVGEGGARELARMLELAPGARVFWPAAEEALPDLEQELGARGVEVLRTAVYRTQLLPRPELDPAVEVRVYMSPSAVQAALDWERAHPGVPTKRLALGRATAEALERASLSAARPRCGDLPIADELVRELALLSTEAR